MTSSNIPSHVPPHLVYDYDWTDMGGEHDVYKHFGKLHDMPDIFFTPRHGGHWVATRYADMEHILSTPEDFSNKHQTLPKNPFVLPLLEHDGEIHKDFRTALAPFFTPKAIGDLEKVSRDLTTSLIDDFIANGECEFVDDFAQKMPIIILMNLLGLPMDDKPYLLPLSHDIVRSGNPELQNAAFAKVGEYIATRVIPARRANPGKDVFSALLTTKVDGGRPVTDEEIIGLGSVLIAAGLDTVASSLSFIAWFLAEHPAQRQQLIDNPALINNALEELLRRYSVPNVARMVLHDMEYKGIVFKAEDCILTPLSAAGIDENRYADASTVDFSRVDKKSLAFGRGPHQCIGSFLARTELRVFLQEWLKRIPHFEVKKGEQPIAVPGKGNGVRYLPITWKSA